MKGMEMLGKLGEKVGCRAGGKKKEQEEETNKANEKVK